MDVELSKLEDVLSSILAKPHPDAEELYKLGIQVGRYLEKNGLPGYRSKVFIDREVVRKNRDTVREKIDALEQLLLKIVKCAIAESIEAGNRWSVSTDNSYTDKGTFGDEISKKYLIQYSRTEQEDTDCDFEVLFDLIGELKEAFESESIPPRFTVSLSNSTGGSSESIYGVGGLSSLYDAKILVNSFDPVWTADRLDKLMENLPSQVSYILLSNS